MKKPIVIFIFLSVLGCRSERIDLTGKFDIVLNNKVQAVLTLTQKNTKLTGFYELIGLASNKRYIFEITGSCSPLSKNKPASILIHVKNNSQIGYILKGNASDSNSFLGTFEQRPEAPLHYLSDNQSLMAIRKK
jgi:hypothetical protein